MAEYYSKEQLLECTKTALQYDMYDLEDFLEEVPTADVVEMKHGEWIAKASTHISKRGRLINYDRYKCSVCGAWNGRHKPDYCPHCGAKMDGRRTE